MHLVILGIVHPTTKITGTGLSSRKAPSEPSSLIEHVSDWRSNRPDSKEKAIIELKKESAIIVRAQID